MLSTYLMFWLAVPIAWVVARWVKRRRQGLMPFAAVALGWALYGIFVAALRQIANPSNSDFSLMFGLVLPSLLVGASAAWPISTWMLDRAMARRQGAGSSTGSTNSETGTGFSSGRPEHSTSFDAAGNAGVGLSAAAMVAAAVPEAEIIAATAAVPESVASQSSAVSAASVTGEDSHAAGAADFSLSNPGVSPVDSTSVPSHDSQVAEGARSAEQDSSVVGGHRPASTESMEPAESTQSSPLSSPEEASRSEEASPTPQATVTADSVSPLDAGEATITGKLAFAAGYSDSDPSLPPAGSLHPYAIPDPIEGDELASAPTQEVEGTNSTSPHGDAPDVMASADVAPPSPAQTDASRSISVPVSAPASSAASGPAVVVPEDAPSDRA